MGNFMNDFETDPTLFDMRDMSPQNELWLGLSRSGSLISDAINILLLSYPSTMRVGREVIIIILWKLTLHCMFDREGEMFSCLILKASSPDFWLELIIDYSEGACFLHRFDHGMCWKCLCGIWNSNYYKYVREQNHVSVCVYVRVDDMHFYVQRFRVPCEFFTSARKLLELSSISYFLQLYPMVLSWSFAVDSGLCAI